MSSLGDNKDVHSLERNVIACFLSSGSASKEMCLLNLSPNIITKNKGGGCKITFPLHQDEKAFKTYSAQHIHLRIGVVAIN